MEKYSNVYQHEKFNGSSLNIDIIFYFLQLSKYFFTQKLRIYINLKLKKNVMD